MTSKTRKRPPNVPMDSPLTTNIRTQAGKRVSSGALQQGQNLVQIPHAQVQANLTLNDEIGLEDNQLGGYHTASSLIEGSVQQNRSELSSGSTEVQQTPNSSQGNDKRRRGPTHMLEIWGRPPNLPRIQLEFDRFGRPKGPNQSKFSEFLGTIARKGTHCPLDAEDWHKIPIHYKMKMLYVIKSRYDISLGDEDRILSSINKKWRNWKSNLKKQYYDSVKDVVRPLDEDDAARVLPGQWINLVAYWKRDEVKARSHKNKDARSQRIMDHLTGKTPFAKVYDKLAKEKCRSPSRAKMVDSCYSSKDGSTAPNVSKYLEQIEQLRNQLPEGSEDPVGPNDLFAQVFGPDKPGRVRMFGEGVIPSDLWGEVPNKRTLKRKVLEQEAKMLKMENEIADLQSKVLTQQSSQNITAVSHSLLRPTSSIPHLPIGVRVALRSVSDKETIVAEGCLNRIDPNTDVGLQVLGENWCQVHVKVVLQYDELLVQPFGFCHTLGDAFGEEIAWPSDFVTRIG